MATAYNYAVSISVIISNKVYDIEPSAILSITINRDYDKYNMPSVYIGIQLSATLYNKMVTNSDTGTISFKLSKFDVNASNPILEPYFEDKFIYIMTTSANYNESLEQLSDDQSENYMKGYIGLISLKTMNDNKKLFNGILKNTNVASIVHKYTNHMNMCIEPLETNSNIDQFIIPPITSISSLLEYINYNYCFYQSGYRFFRDFDVTYLLSMKGTPVENKNSKYNTVIIGVMDPTDDNANVNAIILDDTNKAYIVYVNADDTSLYTDRVADKLYNHIIGVSTLGNTVESDLDIPTYSESTQKVIMERVSNDNLSMSYNTKTAIESNSVILTITKNEIDSSIFTPNKEYQVKMHKLNTEYNGRYVLSFKKEVYYKQGDTFINSVVIGLRKCA